MKRSGFKKKIGKPMKRTPLKKVSSIGSFIGSLRNKCDKHLSPLIVKLYPKCLLCGKPSQVAHHFVHKSKSNFLRYEFTNLIPLCHSCHFALHNNESLYAGRIINIKGLIWFNNLEVMKRASIRVNRQRYERVLEFLADLLENRS
jgi:5-methylcytosine-specific restriction endonuclease McrA